MEAISCWENKGSFHPLMENHAVLELDMTWVKFFQFMCHNTMVYSEKVRVSGESFPATNREWDGLSFSQLCLTLNGLSQLITLWDKNISFFCAMIWKMLGTTTLEIHSLTYSKRNACCNHSGTGLVDFYLYVFHDRFLSTLWNNNSLWKICQRKKFKRSPPASLNWWNFWHLKPQ